MGDAARDLNLLVPLRALLVEANVTRAGQSIAMGQSSMSAALAKLRLHFDDELLVRVGRDYELTPLARLLLPQVQLTLPSVERALLGATAFDPGGSTRSFTLLASDFAALELKPALAAVVAAAPGVKIDLGPLPSQPTESERDLINSDFVAALPGIGIEGRSAALFVDHYVCLVDPGNPALVDGLLTWDAFRSLPQVVAGFGRAHVTPAERTLRELGFSRVPRVTTIGFLPVPSVVAGTDLVAVVPSRLAARLGPSSGTIGVPTPFARVEIHETLWWHPSHDVDPGHSWLRETLLAAVRGLPAGARP